MSGPSLAAAVQQLGGPVHVVGAEDQVDVGRPLADAVLVLLGQAAGDHDLHAGLAVLHRLEVAEGAVELVVGVLPDAAGVEDDDVGLVEVGGGLHAVGLEQPGDPLRVVLVHLAPEGADQVAPGLRRRRRSRSWPVQSTGRRTQSARPTVRAVRRQPTGKAIGSPDRPAFTPRVTSSARTSATPASTPSSACGGHVAGRDSSVRRCRPPCRCRCSRRARR